MNELEKICINCNESKSISDFYVNRNICKNCHIHSRYYDTRKKYYDLHKIELNKRSREYKKSRISNELLTGAKHRAKEKQLDFNLNLSDIVIPEFCPILKIKLEKSKTGKPCDSSPSLDRIFPELGYVKGNVRVISYKANRLKNSLTKEILNNLLLYIDGKI